MYGYVDESGNTGLDIFSSQKNFYLGAIISENDLDTHLHPIITKHKTRLGIAKIHAVDIDFNNLELILIDILAAIKQINFEYYFSNIEKAYYVVCQFFDIFFDSHDNQVISPGEYYDSLFKHSAIIELDKLITLDEKRQFWKALGTPKTRIATFEQITTSLARRIKPNKNHLYDRMCDAMQFASRNASSFDYGKFNKKLNSPNAIAFSGFLHRYHHTINLKNTPPTSIIVDREQQFNSIFIFYRDALEKCYMTPQEDSIYPSLMQESKFSLPPLTIVDGATSNALQALDVLLYISRSNNTKLKAILETAIGNDSEEFAITSETSTFICASRILAMQ